MTKSCKRCGEQRILETGFYRDKRMADGHFNICTVCVREQRRAHRAENIDRLREYDRRRGYRGDPAKQRARIMVRNAIARGDIERRPCEVCAAPQAEAHHDDYAKPLDVRWLCRRHHAEHHRTYD